MPFSVEVRGGTPGASTDFKWTVWGGTLNSGQGTDAVSVRAGDGAGRNILAKVEVGGYGAAAPCSATCVTELVTPRTPLRVLVRDSKYGRPVKGAQVSVIGDDGERVFPTADAAQVPAQLLTETPAQVPAQATAQVPAQATAQDAPAPCPPRARRKAPRQKFVRYRRAFISYASEDRAEVLKRVQMLATVKIEFFQDLLSLEPGDRWERMLYKHIDESDVVYLFWSSAAKRSKWVEREVKYALERRKEDTDDDIRPAIVPVIIEGPPFIPPPKHLEEFHFNDKLVYFMQEDEPARRSSKKAAARAGRKPRKRAAT